MSDRDGRDAGSPIFGAGVINQSIEMKERLWPVTIQHLSHKTDSMGAGRFRGGCGLDSAITFDNGGGVLLSHCGDRGKFGPGGPPGLFNGKRGIYQGVTHDPGGPKEKWLDLMFSGLKVEKGAVLAHYTQGGGGYGDPLQRDPNAVLEDVLDEFVSLESARDEYGVVINAIDPEILDYRIDWDATKKLREDTRRAR